MIGNEKEAGCDTRPNELLLFKGEIKVKCMREVGVHLIIR